jgi:hypothetical protein
MIERGMAPNDPGEVHFSMKAFVDSVRILPEALVKGPYAQKALVPPSPWLDSQAPEAPQVQSFSKRDTLFLQRTGHNSDVFQWVVYFKIQANWHYQILNGSQNEFRLPLSRKAKTDEAETSVKQVLVSYVDRLGNESSKQVVFTGVK